MEKGFKHSFKAAQPTDLPLTVYNAGFQKCSPGYSWGPGVRDHYLLHYIVSGRGRYVVQGRTFVLKGGEAFLGWPEAELYYEADTGEPWEYYWVGFSGPQAALLLGETAFTRSEPVVHVAAGERLRQGLLDVYKARGGDYAAAVRMAGYLQAALGLLMGDEGRKTGREALTDYGRQGAQYLRQNYSRPIGVEELARETGISRSYLYRAFQAEYGCSPSAYLTEQRIQRACQLLAHSTLSIGTVAASVGYEDAFYFSRVFKKVMGLSPTAYREREAKPAP